MKKGKENVLVIKRGSFSRFSERDVNRSTSANRAFGTEITNISHNIANQSRVQSIVMNSIKDSKSARQYQSLSFDRLSGKEKTPQIRDASSASRQSHPLQRVPSSNRASKEKLPKISVVEKQQMFINRCDRFIYQKIPKFDLENIKNIYEVSEFAEDIHQHMKSTEIDGQPSSSYMKKQTDINESMRAILVDWLIDVHLKFKLLNETLFLTVNIIDRYLTLRNGLQRSKLQLVGVGALLISTKYEEIYPPTVKDLVYITDNAYSKEEILIMESNILIALDFSIQQNSQYRFLERYCRIAKADTVMFTLAQYFLELGLLDSKMSKFLPSEQAAAAVLVAQRKVKKYNTIDISKLDKHTGHTDESLKPCAQVYENLSKSIVNSTLKAVYRKFKSGKYYEVTRILQQSPQTQIEPQQ
ncbi:UNKNOWN [Stylonychia lemnae]|uniref:Cyclin N-terminal domain-containing protein n=1 Tax=Stylonychia lemnae TaxID=5949 RepID=A0A078ACG0_STYLE|nr:UNKNOWN [Stylonychia lemnae]|eukprot:CDW79874.1 UNKNOWN [Stylonychia lemnae]